MQVKENPPLLIFLDDQLPFFLGEIVENFLQEISMFLPVSDFKDFAFKAPCFLQEIPVFLPEISLKISFFSLKS